MSRIILNPEYYLYTKNFENIYSRTEIKGFIELLKIYFKFSLKIKLVNIFVLFETYDIHFLFKKRMTKESESMFLKGSYFTKTITIILTYISIVNKAIIEIKKK